MSPRSVAIAGSIRTVGSRDFVFVGRHMGRSTLHAGAPTKLVLPSRRRRCFPCPRGYIARPSNRVMASAGHALERPSPECRRWAGSTVASPRGRRRRWMAALICVSWSLFALAGAAEVRKRPGAESTAGRRLGGWLVVGQSSVRTRHHSRAPRTRLPGQAQGGDLRRAGAPRLPRHASDRGGPAHRQADSRRVRLPRGQ